MEGVIKVGYSGRQMLRDQEKGHKPTEQEETGRSLVTQP